MPLEHSASESAFHQNVSEMVKAGHPQKQAVAAAYRIKRQAAHDHAEAGEIVTRHGPAAKFSWTPFKTKKGSQGAVNETGYKLYGKRAAAALAAQQQAASHAQGKAGPVGQDLHSQVTAHLQGLAQSTGYKNFDPKHVDATTGQLAKLKVTDLQSVAKEFGIQRRLKTKQDIVGAIGDKIKNRWADNQRLDHMRGEATIKDAPPGHHVPALPDFTAAVARKRTAAAGAGQKASPPAKPAAKTPSSKPAAGAPKEHYAVAGPGDRHDTVEHHTQEMHGWQKQLQNEAAHINHQVQSGKMSREQGQKELNDAITEANGYMQAHNKALQRLKGGKAETAKSPAKAGATPPKAAPSSLAGLAGKWEAAANKTKHQATSRNEAAAWPPAKPVQETPAKAAAKPAEKPAAKAPAAPLAPPADVGALKAKHQELQKKIGGLEQSIARNRGKLPYDVLKADHDRLQQHKAAAAAIEKQLQAHAAPAPAASPAPAKSPAKAPAKAPVPAATSPAKAPAKPAASPPAKVGAQPAAGTGGSNAVHLLRLKNLANQAAAGKLKQGDLYSHIEKLGKQLQPAQAQQLAKTLTGKESANKDDALSNITDHIKAAHRGKGRMPFAEFREGGANGRTSLSPAPTTNMADMSPNDIETRKAKMINDAKRAEMKAKEEATNPPPAPRLAKVNGVEIFASGNHRGKDYTNQDLDKIVENFSALHHLIQPPVVIGHEEHQELLDNTGIPATGQVEKVWRDGDKLMADFTDVPEPVARLINQRAYRKVSSELYDDFEHEGQPHGIALRRVALLGGELPQVKTLADMPMATFAEAAGRKITRITIDVRRVYRTSDGRWQFPGVARVRKFSEDVKAGRKVEKFSWHLLGQSKAGHAVVADDAGHKAYGKKAEQIIARQRNSQAGASTNQQVHAGVLKAPAGGGTMTYHRPGRSAVTVGGGQQARTETTHKGGGKLSIHQVKQLPRGVQIIEDPLVAKVKAVGHGVVQAGRAAVDTAKQVGTAAATAGRAGAAVGRGLYHLARRVVGKHAEAFAEGSDISALMGGEHLTKMAEDLRGELGSAPHRYSDKHLHAALKGAVRKFSWREFKTGKGTTGAVNDQGKKAYGKRVSSLLKKNFRLILKGKVHKFSWREFKTQKGSVGAINDQGKKAYGKKAKALLSKQGKSGGDGGVSGASKPAAQPAAAKKPSLMEKAHRDPGPQHQPAETPKAAAPLKPAAVAPATKPATPAPKLAAAAPAAVAPAAPSLKAPESPSFETGDKALQDLWHAHREYASKTGQRRLPSEKIDEARAHLKGLSDEDARNLAGAYGHEAPLFGATSSARRHLDDMALAAGYGLKPNYEGLKGFEHNLPGMRMNATPHHKLQAPAGSPGTAEKPGLLQKAKDWLHRNKGAVGQVAGAIGGALAGAGIGHLLGGHEISGLATGAGIGHVLATPNESGPNVQEKKRKHSEQPGDRYSEARLNVAAKRLLRYADKHGIDLPFAKHAEIHHFCEGRAIAGRVRRFAERGTLHKFSAGAQEFRTATGGVGAVVNGRKYYGKRAKALLGGAARAVGGAAARAGSAIKSAATSGAAKKAASAVGHAVLGQEGVEKIKQAATEGGRKAAAKEIGKAAAGKAKASAVHAISAKLGSALPIETVKELYKKHGPLAAGMGALTYGAMYKSLVPHALALGAAAGGGALGYATGSLGTIGAGSLANRVAEGVATPAKTASAIARKIGGEKTGRKALVAIGKPLRTAERAIKPATDKAIAPIGRAASAAWAAGRKVAAPVMEKAKALYQKLFAKRQAPAEGGGTVEQHAEYADSHAHVRRRLLRRMAESMSDLHHAFHGEHRSFSEDETEQHLHMAAKRLGWC